MQAIGFSSLGFIVLGLLIFFIRKAVTAQKPKLITDTWGCGYTGETQKMQYTASSFIRSYRKLAEPILSVRKKKIEIEGIFPVSGWHETHPHDKIEEWFIDIPWRRLKFFFGKFRFLQNGNVQFYVLYGTIFITLILVFPVLYEAFKKIIYFLNQI